MAEKLFIAVIHDKKLQVRLQTLNALVSKFSQGFKIELIDVYNYDDIKSADIQQNIKLENPKTNSLFDGLVKSMHVKQVSQALKHKTALERFLEQKTFDTMLVIEDDVLHSDNVETELKNALEMLNNNPQCDALFLGVPTPKAVIEQNLKIAPVSDFFKVFPTVDAYLIKRDKAQELLANMLPIRYTINVHYSFLAHQKKWTPYFMSPNIFVNGSKYGVYVSSTDPNNKLFMNPDYNKLMMLNTKTSYTEEEFKQVEEIAKSVALSQHCDFQYQLGLFYMRIGQFQTAKPFFDNAHKVYTDNESIINNESEFLINYARIFKYMQSDRDAINKELDGEKIKV